jgi:sugar/nucleoside kinase (ribokinase family)
MKHVEPPGEHTEGGARRENRCGHAGAIAARGGRFWQCGVFPMAPIDPSGCGDAFSAGVITGHVRRWDLPKILRYASALGASAIQAVGTTTSVFTAGEAEAFLANHRLPLTRGRL